MAGKINTTTTTTAKGLTTQKVILILGSLTIICAAVIIGILLLREPPEKAPGSVQVINKDNITKIESDVKDKVADGMFETHMNTTWEFPDGKSASNNAVMGNSAANRYPFWFTVALEDTNEIVYTSSTLPSGTKVEELKLDKELKKGTYPAVVSIHMVDDKGVEVESNMGFNITLIIKS
jgi:hypothetical protein